MLLPADMGVVLEARTPAVTLTRNSTRNDDSPLRLLNAPARPSYGCIDDVAAQAMVVAQDSIPHRRSIRPSQNVGALHAASPLHDPDSPSHSQQPAPGQTTTDDSAAPRARRGLTRGADGRRGKRVSRRSLLGRPEPDGAKMGGQGARPSWTTAGREGAKQPKWHARPVSSLGHTIPGDGNTHVPGRRTGSRSQTAHFFAVLAPEACALHAKLRENC